MLPLTFSPVQATSPYSPYLLPTPPSRLPHPPPTLLLTTCNQRSLSLLSRPNLVSHSDSHPSHLAFLLQPQSLSRMAPIAGVTTCNQRYPSFIFSFLFPTPSYSPIPITLTSSPLLLGFHRWCHDLQPSPSPSSSSSPPPPPFKANLKSCKTKCLNGASSSFLEGPVFCLGSTLCTAAPCYNLARRRWSHTSVPSRRGPSEFLPAVVRYLTT